MKKTFLTFIALAVLACSTVNATTPDNTTVENPSGTTLTPYQFCFMVLPAFAKGCSPMDKSKNLLTNPIEISKILKKDNLVSPYNLKDIEVNTIKNDAREIIVWTLPQPSQITIPLYVAFVPDKGHYRYFTFEYAMDEEFATGNKYMLGEQTGQEHRSYGLYDIPKDWKGFAEIVINRFLK